LYIRSQPSAPAGVGIVNGLGNFASAMSRS
jgi:hypothetical protein